MARRPTLISPAAQALLEKKMAERAAAGGAPRIPKGPRPPVLPASASQERFWFLALLDPSPSTYHLGWGARIRGPLDVAALGKAYQEIVRRHEGLRTTLRVVDRMLEQVVHATLPMELELATADDEASAQERAREARSRPFDLAGAPLARATLVRLRADDHIFAFVAHHVVSDATSIGVIARELTVLYDAFRQGRPSPLEELPVQYADFTLWQRTWLADGVAARQLAYWKEQLAGAPDALELPTDRPRPLVRSSRGGTIHLALPSDAGAKVAALANAEGATRFVVLLAAFDVLLARLSGQQDIVVGTAVANRGRPELAGLFGCFANTLAVRTKLEGAPTFREVVRRTKKAVLGALDHQDVSFERVVEILEPRRVASRTPVYQVMFAHQVASEPFALAGLEIAPPQRGQNPFSQVDLWLTTTERGEELSGALDYDVDLFDRASAERIASQFEVVLMEALADPDGALATAPAVAADPPRAPAQDEPVTTTEHVAPRSPREEAIARIWQEVLGVARVGVGDDFFALGGHSLRAMYVVSKLYATLGIDVPLRALFQAPTLGAFAALTSDVPSEPLPES